MSTELKAGDTITAESLNGIAEGAYTFKSGEILTASKLNTIAEAIEDKDEEIAELEGQVEELQAIIDAFPTIESLSVTQNGTYQEAGKAYTPVDVSVSSVAVEALSVTQNGTYSEEGKAYSPVTVNVPSAWIARGVGMGFNFSSLNKHIYVIYNSITQPAMNELDSNIVIYNQLVCTESVKASFFGCLIKAIDGTPINVSVAVDGWQGATPRVISGYGDGFTFAGADIRNVTGEPTATVPLNITITPQ